MHYVIPVGHFGNWHTSEGQEEIGKHPSLVAEKYSLPPSQSPTDRCEVSTGKEKHRFPRFYVTMHGQQRARQTKPCLSSSALQRLINLKTHDATTNANLNMTQTRFRN